MAHGKQHPEMCWKPPLAATKLRDSSVKIRWKTTQIVLCVCLVSLEVCKIAQNAPMSHLDFLLHAGSFS